MRFLRFAGVLSLALAIFVGTAATHPESSEKGAELRITHGVNPWTHLDLRNDPHHFQFAIVTDRTGGHRPGVFEDAVTKLNLLQPEFVVSVGNLIEGYTEDLEQLHAEWREFEGFVEQLEMPFFYVPGNHDISNPVMAKEWARRFGASYYHFVYRDVLFLCLNTEDQPPRNLSEEQITFVADGLAEHPDVRWTLVFMHEPLWDYERDTGFRRVEELLQGQPYTVFAGHYHTYTKHVRNDRNYFVLATTGGGSSLRGPMFGEFDHVVWVTMTDRGPRIANLMLEGIWDENVRTEQMAAMMDPLIRGQVVVIQPIFTEARDFESGNTQLRLTNDANVPLRLKGGFGEHASLVVRPDSVEVVVAPHSVALLDLEVEALELKKVEALKPLVLRWSASYDQDEVNLPVVEGTSSLVVAREFDAGSRDTPVVVDGRLEEWEDLPFVMEEPAEIEGDPTSWMGPGDCSWRFGVELDEEYLYIGVEVTDERPIYTGAVAWQQDGIEVRVDGRPDPQRSDHRGQGDLSMEHHIFIALSPGNTREEMITVEPGRLEALGVRAICVPTEAGHNTEIAIPLSYFEERQGKKWREFRLNIAVDDYDEQTGPLSQLWWQPDWRDALNYPGSGTFRWR